METTQILKPTPPRLSESRIQSGRQCHKRLWLELHQADASSWTAAAQVRLDEGTQFGELARELLGGGVLVAADHFQINEALAQTAELLRLPYLQAPMLFEAAFSHEGVRVRVDGFQRHADHDTPVFFTPERFGRWTHLAVVFDPALKEVRHYANGELLASSSLKETAPLKIGIAELGNWNDRRNQGGVAIRHLSGAMDEFALWDRALSTAEIAALAK